jgi:hypothetical protein
VAVADGEISETDVSAPRGGVYVYAIARAGALRAIRTDGVGGAPVDVREEGPLAAVISVLPASTLRVKRHDLQRHLRVIEEAFGETTVLPCPFGTVVASEAELVEAVLAGRRDTLLDALGRLDEKVQLNVKAVYDEDVLLREIVDADPEIARLRERTRRLGDAGYYERVRLGELVAAAVSAHRARDADRLLVTLAQAAADVVAETDDGAALKASFLVARGELDRFDALLEQIALAERPLLRFDVIGPLPPTAFASAYAEG